MIGVSTLTTTIAVVSSTMRIRSAAVPLREAHELPADPFRIDVFEQVIHGTGLPRRRPELRCHEGREGHHRGIGQRSKRATSIDAVLAEPVHVQKHDVGLGVRQ